MVGDSVAGCEGGSMMRTVVIWPVSKLSRRPYLVSRWSIWDRACWADDDDDDDDDAAAAGEVSSDVRNLGTDSMMDLRRSHMS